MSALEFVSALVRSLAWPLVVLAVAFLFRRQLREVLIKPLARLKAGPFEAVWDRQVAEVEATLPEPQPRASDGHDVPDSNGLREIARVVPSAAVLAAFAGVEAMLRQSLLDGGVDVRRSSATQMARKALEAGLVRPEIVKAVEGAAILRNLAAHGQASDLDEARALDYITLTDALTRTLGHQPTP